MAPTLVLIFSSMLFLSFFQTDGRLNGPDPPQLWFHFGDSTGGDYDFFGWRVTGVGDQNNDGYDDVLIADNNINKAFLFLGAEVMDSLPALTFETDDPLFGRRVVNLDDLNGDGYTDYAIGGDSTIYIYHGGILDTIPELSIPPPWWEVTGAGDVNGDGYDDVLVSDLLWNDYRGRAFIYFGGDTMDSLADWSILGDTCRCWFGWSIAGGADVNDDGYDDVAISGVRSLILGTPSYARVFLGGIEMDTIPDLIIDESQFSSSLGREVWLLNDLNGDGYDEIGMVSGADTGLYVFRGGDSLDAVPDLSLRGSGFSSPAELRIASIGDVNGDGYNDLLSGNPEAWNRLGEVLLYLGHPGMSGEFDIGWTGFLSPWDGAGQAVGWCGDVNNDGLNDILFSCWDPFSPNRTGRVDIFGGDTSLVVSVRQPEVDDLKPKEFDLMQNYPNPFNSSTNIHYTAATSSVLSISIYDIQGRLIKILVDRKEHAPGEYSIYWNGTSGNGGYVPSGIYFYTLSSPTGSITRKVTLLR